MAKVIPVGPLNPELYAFAKKQAERAERVPGYVPKKVETPAHSIIYRRAGGAVKAFVIDKIAPVLMGRDWTHALPVVPPLPQGTLPERYEEEAESQTAYFQTGTVANPKRYKAKLTSVSQVNGLAGFSTEAYVVGLSEQVIVDGGSIVIDGVVDHQSVHRMQVFEAPHEYETDTAPAGGGGIPRPVVRFESLTDGAVTESRVEGVNVHVEYNGSPGGYHPLAGTTGTVVSARNYQAYGDSYSEVKLNFIKSHAASAESRLLYARLSPDTLKAKSKEDIRPSEVQEAFICGYIHSYAFDPLDWSFYGFTQNLDLFPSTAYRRYLSTNPSPDVWENGSNDHPEVDPDEPYNTPKESTSAANLQFTGGKMAWLPALAVDCRGDVYYLQTSRDVPASSEAPPWSDSPEFAYYQEFPDAYTIGLFKDGERVATVKTVEASTKYRHRWMRIIETPQAHSQAAISRDGHDPLLIGSMEPEGGAATLFPSDKLYGSFNFDYFAGSCAFVKAGIFLLGWDQRPEGAGKSCVLFIPNPTPDEKHPVIHASEDGPPNFHLLRPHKQYSRDEPEFADRFTRAALFVGARKETETESGRRCYITFDDGVCVDLTDFPKDMGEEGGSAEDWNGRPFKYAPIEPWDDPDGNCPPRRIKRDFAPKWVQAYYDHEDDA